MGVYNRSVFDDTSSVSPVFNFQSLIQGLVYHLSRSFYPPRFDGDPAQHEWDEESLRLISHNRAASAAAIPILKQNLTEIAEKDFNYAMGALEHIVSTEAQQDIEDSYSQNPLRDHGYKPILQQAYDGITADPSDQDTILEKGRLKIEARHQAWVENIHQTVDQTLMPGLARRLLESPKKLWSRIIPEDMSQEDLKVLKGEVDRLAKEGHDHTLGAVDKIEKMALDRRQDYSGLNQRQAMREFVREKREFVDDASKEFRGYGGSKDSFFGQQRSEVMGTIPTRPENLYKDEQSLANTMEGAKNKLGSRFQEFQSEVDAYFTQKIDAAAPQITQADAASAYDAVSAETVYRPLAV